MQWLVFMTIAFMLWGYFVGRIHERNIWQEKLKREQKNDYDQSQEEPPQ